MQKNLFFLLFLCSSSLLVSAQTYVPMPLSNAKWTEGYSTWHYERHANIATTTDTTYNGQTYIGMLYSTGGGYVGGYREDNKIVYYLPPNDTQEVVLYDFNVALGDTVSHWWMATTSIDYDPNNPAVVTISGIDSMLVGTTYRKIYYVTNDTIGMTGTSVVEGIGNLSGLLSAWSIGHLEYNIELTCFRINDTIIWQPDVRGFCTDTTVVGVSELDFPTLQIYPNPTADLVYIQTPEANIYNILIVNALGQQLGAQKINANNAEISLSHLPDGVYYLQVANEAKRVQTHKILKMSR
jgi:hypothetical protein